MALEGCIQAAENCGKGCGKWWGGRRKESGSAYGFRGRGVAEPL